MDQLQPKHEAATRYTTNHPWPQSRGDLDYNRYETGDKSPSAATLAAIAATLDTDPRALTTVAAGEVTLQHLRAFTGFSQREVARRLGYAAGRSYRDI